MVNFKIDKKSLDFIIDRILGQFAFLIQKELIRLFPESFKNRFVVAKEASEWIVGSNYNILRFYDKPTRPHIIEPKVKNALAFAWPKAPGIPGQPRGDGRYLFKKVLHPGTKGKHIIENLEKDKHLLQKLLDQAVRNVVK